jgi:hypothetical protein
VRAIAMAKDQQQRLSARSLKEDRANYIALKDMKDFDPRNKVCSLPNMETLFNNMAVTKAEEVRVQKLLASIMDNAIEAEWAFHNAMLVAKEQVIGQYGSNSNEVQAIGLKKVADYKRPGKRKPSANKAA